MFARLKNFLSNHRQKFIVGGVLIGGVFLASKYAQKLLKEWQERETKELLERARKQQHFESIERTCNQTALTMAPNLRDAIIKLLKTEELINQLKIGAPNKILIWEKLKILAFTKLSVLVYASSVLIMTLRIQLNLIGGYMFRDTTGEIKETQITSGIQEKYLGLCQFFMEEGAKKLCSLVEEKVALVMQDKSLKEKLTLHDIEQIFWAIQSSISNDSRDPCRRLANYILPNSLKRDSYGTHLPVFDKIISETNDLLESEEIINLTGSCISRGFSYVMDQVADYFIERGESSQSDIEQCYLNSMPTTSSAPDSVSMRSVNNATNLNKVTIPMAKVIPIVNGLVQSHSSKDDIPHTWIQQLILMDSLKVMGANIYETFSNVVLCLVVEMQSDIPQQPQEKLDNISKVKSLILPLRESLSQTLKTAAQALHQNSLIDAGSTKCVDAVIPRFDKNLEEFYSICDQIELHLKTASECLSQGSSSARYLQFPVTPTRTEPMPYQDGSSLTYPQYLATVRTQVAYAKEIHDSLTATAQNIAPPE